MKKQFDDKVIYDEIKQKDSIFQGHKFEGTVLKGHKAIVMPSHYIRIYGQEWNRINAPVEFDRTFNIGDMCEYDSYNLIYIGKILAIGPQTITVERKDTGRKPCRLSIEEFSYKNWDFDAVKIAKENHATSMCI